MLLQKNINIMHNGKVNKTRYDDLEKPIKQTTLTKKTWEETFPKAMHYIKEKF